MCFLRLMWPCLCAFMKRAHLQLSDRAARTGSIRYSVPPGLKNIWYRDVFIFLVPTWYRSTGSSDNTSCHVVNLGNRETAVSSSALLQSLWQSCASWVSQLLSKRSRGTLMPHVTVTWRRRRFKSDNISNRHALLQVSRRSVCAVLHEVEHTYTLQNIRFIHAGAVPTHNPTQGR